MRNAALNHCPAFVAVRVGHAVHAGRAGHAAHVLSADCTSVAFGS